MSWRSFDADLCRLRASALTLYTLLSIVPVFAMLFGVAKGFGMERVLQERLLEQLPERQEIAFKLIDFAKALLAKTQGEVVAGIGIAVLFWSVLSLIGEIEKSFNSIWKVPAGRTFGRKISDYLSVMLLAPLLLIISSSLAVYAQSRLAGLASAVNLPQSGTVLLVSIFNYLPLAIVWLLFSFTFIFLPNTKVDYKSGIIAGILTGTAYQLTQWTYLRLQIGVSNYNAIYGSFAALPLFIVWLQVGWLIVLFGAELAFYHQHFESYRSRDDLKPMSFSLQKLAALRITHLLIQRFAAAETPLTAEQIARTLHLPLLAVRAITDALHSMHILARVQSNSGETTAYQPGRDIGQLRIVTIIDALENYGDNVLPENGSLERFKHIAAQLDETVSNSPENRLLKDV
ncbi:MAG: YihY/virulence factor BrkB family protein [Gammaproteobacteria bacterium]